MRRTQVKWTEEMLSKARRMQNQGVPSTRIAQSLGVPGSVVSLRTRLRILEDSGDLAKAAARNPSAYVPPKKPRAPGEIVPPDRISRMAQPNYVPSNPYVRPGAGDFLKHPSRVGERLFYRDGRVEERR